MIREERLNLTSCRQIEVIQGFIAAYNSFNVQTMLGFVHPGVVFKTIADGDVNATTTGLDEFRKMAEQSRLLFSSLRQQITGFESAGDIVAVHIGYEGVLADDLPNGMKAGDTLKRKGRSVFEFLDGQLYRLTDYS